MATVPSITEIVEFGLEGVPEEQTVEVSLRDLLYVHQTLAEFNRFFHQPDHFQTTQAVNAFLGSRGSGGGYEALHQAYYSKLRSMLPTQVQAMVSEGVFEHPSPPSYYGEGL
jgi:hypothetical protein